MATKIVDGVEVPLSEADLAQREIDKAAWQAYLDTEAYKDRRRIEYPPLAEQVDAQNKIVRALIAGTAPPADAVAVLDQVDAVKAKYPKPQAK